MRRVALMTVGAMMAFPVFAPAVAGAGGAEPGHFDREHHDSGAENNCTKYRDQCRYDPRCDCYHRASQPTEDEKAGHGSGEGKSQPPPA